MPGRDPKADLHRALQTARDTLLWKLDGLPEYDARRPLVPTGTNLLGLVKHLAGVEVGYFGDTFGRPLDPPLPWLPPGGAAWDDPTVDMWATADESRDDIVGFYRRASAHADATITALPIDAPGVVPHWPEERRHVTLHFVLVHVVAETSRHTGQADIVRELIDGAAGFRRDVSNLAPGDRAWWESYRDRLERVAREAAERYAP